MSVEFNSRALGGIRVDARKRRLLVAAAANASADEAAEIGAQHRAQRRQAVHQADGRKQIMISYNYVRTLQTETKKIKTK